MNELNHLKTYEQYSFDGEKIEEGLFSSLKTRIDNFLEDPNEESVDKLLKRIFSNVFASPLTKALEKEVMGLPFDDKLVLIKDAKKRLNDPTVTKLKLLKRPSGNLFVGYLTT